MAKRRRKQTLFDVMHTGQPIGLQVRTRVPAYQPTPELPVTKKLAKLFGRTSKPDAKRPRSAAEELDQLRRELGAKRPQSTAAEASAAEPIAADSPAHFDTSADAAPAPVASSFRNAERVAQAFAATEEPSSDAPRTPRRSAGEVFSAQWAVASPKLRAMADHFRTIGGRGIEHARQHGQSVGELYSRYAVTAAAAAGVVILLCGSFYAGKLLFNRPAVTLGGNDAGSLADAEVRPDVLDIGSGSTGANEALANVSDEQTQTKLERAPEAPPTKPGVFGGRRPDLNYVIVQSYFAQSEADATVDVLKKYGVEATVEVNLPRWAPAGRTLYSVVSVEAFARMTGNAEFQGFISKLGKISDKEAGGTLPKKLDPRAYRLQPQT